MTARPSEYRQACRGSVLLWLSLIGALSDILDHPAQKMLSELGPHGFIVQGIKDDDVRIYRSPKDIVTNQGLPSGRS